MVTWSLCVVLLIQNEARKIENPRAAVQAHNSHVWDLEARTQESMLGHPQLHGKFRAGVGCMRAC